MKDKPDLPAALRGYDPKLRSSNSRPLSGLSSPPSQSVPTITPFPFGYTGPHNRRRGAGDRRNRPYAGGTCGAAQKMVCLPEQGACVCRTHPGSLAERHPIRSRRTGVARKNTPNGTRRVSFIKIQFEAPDVSRPKPKNLQRQGRTPSVDRWINILFTIDARIWRKFRFLFVLLLTPVQKENKLKT